MHAQERHAVRLLALLLPVALATGLYVAQTYCLRGWIVDDAGISFAYSRNLAEGEGLVSQPGAEPVEGFTNLSWVLLVALFVKAGRFDPTFTPKLLAGICVALSLGLTGRLLGANGKRPWWLVTGALAVTALLPGFAIWTASGLENGLYALLVAALAVICFRGGSERPGRDHVARDWFPSSVAAGVLLFLVFCTRPDGALYFWVYPFVCGVALGSRACRRPVSAYVVTFVVLWLALTLARLVYYRDVLPNTFYAKSGEGVAYFAWLLRELPLAGAGTAVAVTGTLAIAGIGAGFAAIGARLHGRVPTTAVRSGILGAFFASAILIYHALRGDWMPEFRFATPAFLFGPAAVFGALWDVLSRWRRGGASIAAVATLALVIAVGASSRRRVAAFAADPTISLDSVRELSLWIEGIVEPIGRRVTVLTPDIGGALWEDRFDVLDLMGLIDRPVAHEYHGRERLRVHILHERKPEVVWHHGAWMNRAGLANDAEFAAMYVPVWEQRSSPEAPPSAGLYVVRELASRCAPATRDDRAAGDR